MNLSIDPRGREATTGPNADKETFTWRWVPLDKNFGEPQLQYRFRLNGWQRIGMVLSVVWAALGGLWGNHIAIQQNGAVPIAHYKWCISHPNYDDDECSAAFDEEYAVGVRGHWASATMVALIPIPVAWLLVYIVVWAVRWMRRGLQPST